MASRIFIIDDDPNMIKIATDLLKPEGYVVTYSTDSLKGIQTVRANPPDLLLLDIRMPGKDGYEVCKEIKSDPKTKHVPIIMLSIKSEPTDVVLGFELGAEDYLRKPYSEIELLARVRNVLRRKDPMPPSDKLEMGPLCVDYGTYVATINGKSLALTPKEFELLGFMLRREGRVLTRALISEALWGVEHLSTSRSIDYHVDQIRKKLGKYGEWVKNLRGVGYRFELEE